MWLLFLHGPPASGKLTIARELKTLTGFQLFHNHLAVDLLESVFEFPPLRADIELDTGALSPAEAARVVHAGLAA